MNDFQIRVIARRLRRPGAGRRLARSLRRLLRRLKPVSPVPAGRAASKRRASVGRETVVAAVLTVSTAVGSAPAWAQKPPAPSAAVAWPMPGADSEVRPFNNRGQIVGFFLDLAS